MHKMERTERLLLLPAEDSLVTRRASRGPQLLQYCRRQYQDGSEIPALALLGAAGHLASCCPAMEGGGSFFVLLVRLWGRRPAES